MYLMFSNIKGGEGLAVLGFKDRDALLCCLSGFDVPPTFVESFEALQTEDDKYNTYLVVKAVIKRIKAKSVKFKYDLQDI